MGGLPLQIAVCWWYRKPTRKALHSGGSEWVEQGTTLMCASPSTNHAPYPVFSTSPQALPATSTLGWLRVDARLFKQSLLTCAGKLSHAFTSHLQTQVDFFVEA